MRPIHRTGRRYTCGNLPCTFNDVTVRYTGSIANIRGGNIIHLSSQDNATVSITGGTFGTGGDNTTGAHLNGTANISGGTFYGDTQISASGTVSGGTFYSYPALRTLTVTGGTFNAGAHLGNATITGGTFIGAVNAATATLKGGTFSNISSTNYLSGRLADGYVFVDTNDTYQDATLVKVLTNVKVVSRSNVLALSVSRNPNQPYVVLGTSITYTATPSNANGTVTYQWYSKPDGATDYTPIDGATANTYTFTTDVVGDYSFRVVAKDSSGYAAAAQTATTFSNIRIINKPTAIDNLVYNGEAQQLINAGTASDGQMYYSLSADGEFTDTVPTATDAGDYTVYYYAGSGSVHTETQSIPVCIAKIDPSNLSPLGGSYNYGQTISYSYIKRIRYKNESSSSDHLNLSEGITYYWNDTYDNTTGTPLTGEETFSVGTYYIYAVYADGLKNFNAGPTLCAGLVITKVSPQDDITSPKLTYNGAKQLLVNATNINPNVIFSPYNSSYSGSGKPYELIDGLPYAKDAGRYNVYYTIAETDTTFSYSSSITLNISTLQISDITPAQTVYEYGALKSNTGYTLKISKVSGILSGDDVTVDASSEVKINTSNNINVGKNEYRILNNNVKLTGTDAGNYTLNPRNVKLTITPKHISINSVTVKDKFYDGTTNATVSAVSFDGLVFGDMMTTCYTVTATSATAEVGTDVPVTGTITLKNELPAGNYVLDNGAFTSKHNIDKRKISL